MTSRPPKTPHPAQSPDLSTELAGAKAASNPGSGTGLGAGANVAAPNPDLRAGVAGAKAASSPDLGAGPAGAVRGDVREEGRPTKITIHFPDEFSLMAVKVVLAYEAEMRGLSIGQTCAELLAENADTARYPQEVLDRLEAIQAATRRRAARRVLE